MKQFLRNNGLSLVFLALFIFSMCGQAITGFNEHNGDREEEGASKLAFSQYLTSGHFIQSTFENWESEFLQMALFVTLSISLFQKGSSESKDPDKQEEVDREPDPNAPDAPWAVKQGGTILALYKNSLAYVLWLLFFISFGMHWMGSLKDHNSEQALKGEPLSSAFSYLQQSRFWFESLQNWQSEFLSVYAIIMLTIFLRAKGSPQSKPVDAANNETGE
jgi:hypothetical protein